MCLWLTILVYLFYLQIASPTPPPLAEWIHNRNNGNEPMCSDELMVNWMVTDPNMEERAIVEEFYVRCRRGIPYLEYKAVDPELTPSDYLEGLASMLYTKKDQMKEELNLVLDPDTGHFIVQSIDSPFPRYFSLPARGNAYATHIAQLEHFAEQYEYLVAIGRLPAEFLSIARGAREEVIPLLIGIIYPDGGCSYVADNAGRNYLAESPPVLGPGCRKDMRSLRLVMNYYLQSKMLGAYGHFVHAPMDVVQRSPLAASAMTIGKSTFELENAYNDGRVLVLDNFLSPVAYHELRKLSLESTTWFDGAKKGYLGTYAEDGMLSPWIRHLTNDLRVKFPTIIGDLPLRMSWMFKCDSFEEERSVVMHADLARVNVNIWLTPDDANTDSGGDSGGLEVWDKAPSDPFDPMWQIFQDSEETGAAPAIEQWLVDNDATSVKVGYKCNRAVIFDSARIHRSVKHHFKGGYTNRRINLTLLFGIAEVLNATTTETEAGTGVEAGVGASTDTRKEPRREFKSSRVFFE